MAVVQKGIRTGGVVTGAGMGTQQGFGGGVIITGGGAGTGTGTVVKGGAGVVSGGGDTRTRIISRKTMLIEKKIPVAANYQTQWDGAATTEAKVDILAQMLGLKL